MRYSILLLTFLSLSLAVSAQREIEITYTPVDIHDAENDAEIGQLFDFGAQYVLEKGGQENLLAPGTYKIAEIYSVGQYINKTGSRYKFKAGVVETQPGSKVIDLFFTVWSSHSGEREVTSYQIGNRWRDSWIGRVYPVAEEEEEQPQEEQPSEEQPVEETPVEEVPSEEEQPAEETPVEETPNEEETPVEEAPAEETPVEETPNEEETPVEETPNEEETPVEETPNEEAPAEETPSEEEQPAEETPVEEAPVEETGPINSIWSDDARAQIGDDTALLELGEFGFEAALNESYKEGLPRSQTFYQIDEVVFVTRESDDSDSRREMSIWEVVFSDEQNIFRLNFVVTYVPPSNDKKLYASGYSEF